MEQNRIKERLLKMYALATEGVDGERDADCLAEGITKYTNGVYTYTENGKKIFHADLDTPRKAYAALIDRINGKGTWNKNPWVFIYEFKLVKK